MRITSQSIALVIVALLVAAACDEHRGSPTAPTGAVAGPPAPVAPAPSPAPDLSKLVGVWSLTMRLTAVTGSGCVAETMQADIGVPSAYSLSITEKGSNVEVRLASASGEYACAFTPGADSTGFTTFGQHGYFTCSHDFPILGFRCADGTLHNLFSWGQDISGRVSGTEISGAWDAVWDDVGTGFGVATKAQFSGSR